MQVTKWRFLQQSSKQPTRQCASKPHIVTVLVAPSEHQAVRKAVFCIELQNATWLENPAYLRQHQTLTIFRRQLEDRSRSRGAPLKDEIKNDNIVGIVRIGQRAVVAAARKVDVQLRLLFATNSREKQIEQSNV